MPTLALRRLVVAPPLQFPPAAAGHPSIPARYLQYVAFPPPKWPRGQIGDTGRALSNSCKTLFELFFAVHGGQAGFSIVLELIFQCVQQDTSPLHAKITLPRNPSPASKMKNDTKRYVITAADRLCYTLVANEPL